MNKKVINATSVSEDSITFKSKAEKRMYDLLKESGLSFEYEPSSITVVEGFYPKPWYKDLQKVVRKVLPIRYTPDFVVKGKESTYIIEVKGFEVEKYSMRRKLFLGLLKDRDDVIFFEVHTVKGMKFCIERIKESENEYTGRKNQEPS